MPLSVAWAGVPVCIYVLVGVHVPVCVNGGGGGVVWWMRARVCRWMGVCVWQPKTIPLLGLRVLSLQWLPMLLQRTEDFSKIE